MNSQTQLYIGLVCTAIGAFCIGLLTPSVIDPIHTYYSSLGGPNRSHHLLHVSCYDSSGPVADQDVIAIGYNGDHNHMLLELPVRDRYPTEKETLDIDTSKSLCRVWSAEAYNGDK